MFLLKKSALVCFFYMASVLFAGNAFPMEGHINIEGWLEGEKRLNDESVFVGGPLLMTSGYAAEDMFLRDARREANTINILGDRSEELEIEGFRFGSGNFRAPSRFLHGTKRGEDDNLSVTWTQDIHRNYITLIFVGVEDVNTASTTGEEALSVYHNDYKLGTYRIGNRTDLTYSYPYSARVARDAGELPIEVNWEDNFSRQVQHGFTIRQRRNFLRGDTLRIVAETPGSYRISSVMLVQFHDTVKVPEHEILHPEVKVWQAGRQPEGHAGTLQFAWVTPISSRCRLIYNTDRQALESGYGRIFSDDIYRDNHQYYSDLELDVGRTVYYRILAESNDGKRFVTPILDYTRPALPMQVQSGRIELEAIDEVNLASPAYGSVPFVSGSLYGISNLQMVNATTGKSIPAQFRKVSLYPDDSVRWLGIDFSVEPEMHYALEYGPDISPHSDDSGLKIIRHTDGTVEVSNEDIKALFDPSAPAGVRLIEHNSKGEVLSFTPANMRLFQTGLDGTRFAAGPPSCFRIIRSGSRNITIRTEGHFLSDQGEPLMHYIMRWRMYAGYPGIDIELTAGNDRDEDKYACFPPEGRPSPGPYRNEKPLNWYFVKFHDMYLELELPERGEAHAGMDGDWIDCGAGDFRYFQRDQNTVYTADAETIESRLDGRLLWNTGLHSLAVGFDRFWQQYPKSFEKQGTSLRIGIMPGFESHYYPDERIDEETGMFHNYSRSIRLWYFLRGGHYRMMYGKQKTHRFSLLFGDEAGEHVSSERLMPATAFFMPAPSYLCANPPYGDFTRIKAYDGTYSSVNEWIERAFERILEGQGDYGMLNFGDVWGERTFRNWLGPGHHCLASAYSREFWRTGRREWLGMAYEAAMHYSDVDTINYGIARGFQVSHAACHTGTEYVRQDGLGHGGYSCSLHAGHMRITGIRNMSAISGSDRLRESAETGGERRGLYTSYLLPTQAHRGKNIDYQFMSYELESNPFNLNAARIGFDRMVFDIDPFTGGGYTNVPKGYYEITGDERVDYVVSAGFKRIPWDSYLKLKVAVPWHAVRQMRVTPEPIQTGGEAFLATGNIFYRDILEDHMAYSLSIEPSGSLVQIADRLSLVNFPSWTYYLDAAGIGDITPRELPDEAKNHYDAILRLGIADD